jgi:hypothetical protein
MTPRVHGSFPQLEFFLCLPAILGNYDACFAALCFAYAKIVFGCCGLSRLKLQAGVSGAATLRFATSGDIIGPSNTKNAVSYSAEWPGTMTWQLAAVL